MNLPLLTVEPELIDGGLLQYLSGVAQFKGSKSDPRDQKIVKLYAAAKEGKKLVHLPTAISEWGFYAETHLPKLALAGAGTHYLTVFLNTNSIRYASHKTDATTGYNGPHYSYDKSVALRTPLGNTVNQAQGSTVVPIVPPAIRPSELEIDRFSTHQLIWEAAWQPFAPTDVTLVKALLEDIYEVIADYQLTDVERSLLSAVK